MDKIRLISWQVEIDDMIIAMSLQWWYMVAYPSCIAVFWPFQLVQEIIHQLYYLWLSNWIGLPFIQGLLDGSGVSQVDETTHLLELGSDEFWETGLTLGILKNEWVEVRHKRSIESGWIKMRRDWTAAQQLVLEHDWYLYVYIYIYIYTVYTYCIRLYIIYRVIIYTVLR